MLVGLPIGWGHRFHHDSWFWVVTSTKSICYDEALLDKIGWENTLVNFHSIRNKGMPGKVVNA